MVTGQNRRFLFLQGPHGPFFRRLAKMLRAAGYATGHVGKWHVGYSTATRPLAQGFDETYGHIGGCIDNYSHYFFWSGPNRHDLWRNGREIWEDGKFFPDLMVRECKRFFEENRARPFFLSRVGH